MAIEDNTADIIVSDKVPSNIVPPLQMEGAVGPLPSLPYVDLEDHSQDTSFASESALVLQGQSPDLYEDISNEESILSPQSLRPVSPSPYSAIISPASVRFDDDDSTDSFGFFDERSIPLSVSSVESLAESPASPTFDYKPAESLGFFFRNKIPAALPSSSSEQQKSEEPSTSCKRRLDIYSVADSLPSANRNWTIYLEDLNESKRLRHERMRRQSENVHEFVRRFHC